MKHTSEFPREIIELPNVDIIMPDGCRLSARIWMPKDAEQNPVPAILEHLPYRKRDGTIERDQFSHPWMAGQGYCCIRTDMRGSGESDGLLTDEYTEQELSDACSVIEWAAAQTWCNGNVGMQGISWGGFNALQVAALNPPALKAIITICSTVDRYADDIHYKGGCLLLENFGWSNTMLSYSSRPPDPDLSGNRWIETWKERLENMPDFWNIWHRHQHRDAYWKHGSVCEDYSAIKAACLSVGGWHDGYRNTISHLVKNLDAPVKGIVGPWNHKYPHYAGPKPAIGFLQEAKNWWDRWLKGIDNNADSLPDYRAYVMDSVAPKRWHDHRPGRWISEPDWPSDNIKSKVFHLGVNTFEEDPVECGLSVTSPQDCGLESGEFFPFAFAEELPGEQSVDDERSLCIDGEVLADTMDIVGAPEFALKFSADKSDALISVRLCDLRPDGSSALITHGVLNLTHHASHEVPEALVPGQTYEASFTLDQIAYRIPRGHRLRLAVSTAYWPFVWPSPEHASVTIQTGSIAVPIRDKVVDAAEWEFEEPVGAPPWKTEILREGGYRRHLERQSETGIVTLIIEEDSGELRDLEHGLVSGSKFSEKYQIDPKDPLSATVIAEWQQTGGRPSRMWETRVSTQMSSTKTHFLYRGQLAALLEGEVIFEKEFEDRIKRRFV